MRRLDYSDTRAHADFSRWFYAGMTVVFRSVWRRATFIRAGWCIVKPASPCALEPEVEFGTGRCVMCALARASNVFASDQGKDAAHATGPQVPAAVKQRNLMM